MIPNKSK